MLSIIAQVRQEYILFSYTKIKTKQKHNEHQDDIH